MDEETEMHFNDNNNNNNEFLNDENEQIKTLFFQKFNALEEELNKNKPIRVQEMMEQSPSFVYMKNQFCDSQTTSVYNNNSFQIFSGSDSSQQLPFPTNLYSTIPTTTYS